MSVAVADVLSRAADLLEPEGRWTKDAFSRNADGSVDENSSGDAIVALNPVCWCAMGAIAQIAGVSPVAKRVWLIGEENGAGPAYRFFKDHFAALGIEDVDVPEWNDAPERTQSEVVAKLREAASLARGSL